MGRPTDGRDSNTRLRLGVVPAQRLPTKHESRPPLTTSRRLGRCLAIVLLALCLPAPSAAGASEPVYTPAPGSPLTGLGGAGDVAFSPSGRLLAHGTEMLSVGASGALTPLGGASPDPAARAVAFSPGGGLLAAQNSGSNTISMFSVGATGALTQVSGSPFALSAQPTSGLFSPSGKLLAVTAGAEAETQALYMFSVSATGALTPVPGSPYAVSSSEHIAFSPTGGLLAAQTKTAVKMFSVGSSGALTEVPGSPFAPSAGPPAGIAFRPNGQLLTALATQLITVYSVASSGALTSLGSGVGPANSQPGPDTFSPEGNLVAAPVYDSQHVQVASVGPSGAVSVPPGSSYQTLGESSIAFSASGLLATTSGGGDVTVLVPSSLSASTNWAGAFGSEGYDLAAWEGERDLSYLPDASVSLAKGSRCLWAANTSNTSALSSPDGSTRTAAGYCDPTEVQVKLTFHAAYTGNLRVYALDWGEGGGKEHEVISVGGSSVLVQNNPDMGSQAFSDGEWAIFPVSEPAGGSVTITAKVEAGWPKGAVLSGIFLGDGGPPPVAVTTAPEGSWAGAVGVSGYDLADWDGAGDVSDMPGASVSLLQGSRYQWAANTTDARALQSPDGTTRSASTYYDWNQLQLKMSFPAAYSGNLHLYALDWDSLGRRERITVNGQTAELASDFSKGAWVSFPISVAAGGTVTITVDRLAGPNAVLSGIFLGDAGAPPAPAVASAPQGAWVNAVGSAGYDLGGWNGSTDLQSLPNASLSTEQASRYTWAASTADSRALQSPDKSTRVAATYYDWNQIRLTLHFSAAYSGNLHLYALDWDSLGRREIISVNGQSAVLSSDFSNGAWVSFPISVAAGGTVTITVDRLAGPNAVLSGIFLGDSGTPPSPPQGTLIPLYDNGNPADWAQACSQTNSSGGGSMLIADVAEGQGPGSAPVPAWANVIENCNSYGRASVIGYVWTDYGEGGQASIAGIESQINAWYSYYPGQIAGIFLDGVSDEVPGTTTSNQSFYRTLASYVHTHEGSGAEVVFNFGANPGSDWMLNSSAANNANLVVTFEGSYNTPGEGPYTSWTQAAWESAYPAHDFAALIYNAPGEAAAPQPASACSSLARQNIGYVYLGTWYDQLAPYFGSFLTDAAGGNC
jgi:Spherulation-specific family 4